MDFLGNGPATGKEASPEGGAFARRLDDILNRVLILGAALFTPALILALARSAYLGWEPSLLFGASLVALLWGTVLLRHRLPYGWRLAIMLGVLWIDLVVGLYTLGPIADAKAASVLLALLAMLFLSNLGGWLFVGSSLLALVGVAVAMILHVATPVVVNYQHYAYQPLTWMSTVYMLAAFSAVAAYVVLLVVNAQRDLLHEVQTKEDMHRTVLRTMKEGVLMYDAMGQLTFCNEAAERTLGLTANQLGGAQPIPEGWAAIHEDGAPFPQEEHPSLVALGTGRPQHNQVMGIQKPDGSLTWLLVNSEPLFTGYCTAPTGVVTSFIDITRRKEADVARQETERRLTTLIEALPDAIFFKDGRGRWQVTNAAGLRLFGLLGRPWQGRTDGDLAQAYPHLGEALDACIQSDEAAWTHGSATRGEEVVADPEHGYRILDVTKIPLFTEEGERSGLVIFGRDVTEQRRSEEHIRKLSRVIEQAPVSILITDLEATIEFVNPAFEATTGYSAAEAIGRNPSLLHSGKQSEEFYRRMWETLKQGRVWAGELCNRRKDGELYWEMATIAPIRDDQGQITHYVGVKENITTRKQAEASLIRARERSDEANVAKSAFLANMSHELRTPLNTILGFAQVLAQAPRLDAAQRRQAEHIHQGGEYLLRLINDILDLSKIEAGRFELTNGPFDPCALVRDCLNMFRLKADQKGIALAFEESSPLSATLEGDEKRIRQLLINLLGNATKFTERGVVTLRAGYVTGRLQIAVEDTGVGIAIEDQKRIFEPFGQTGADRFKVQGTGLGLSISRRLVELMGGSLDVASTPGIGTTFLVDIPLPVSRQPVVPLDPEARREVVGYRRTQGEGAFRVLVADDVQLNRLLLASLVEPLGFETREAEDGKQSVAIAAEWTPDLVLMDLRMPGIDGLEATRRIRATLPRRTTRIVVVSASAFDEDRRDATEAGCDAFLIKPVQLPELTRVLGEQLPLEWVCTAAPAAPSGPPLSDAQRNQLLQFVKLGDVRGLRAYLDELGAAPSPPGGLAQIRELAAQFHLREIRDLLEG